MQLLDHIFQIEKQGKQLEEHFQINNDKLDVPVVMLSINNIKFLKSIKKGFKRTFS